jgi:hypothetical protein
MGRDGPHVRSDRGLHRGLDRGLDGAYLEEEVSDGPHVREGVQDHVDVVRVLQVVQPHETCSGAAVVKVR